MEHYHYVAHGQWDVMGAKLNSTWHELQAVRILNTNVELHKWLSDDLKLNVPCILYLLNWDGPRLFDIFTMCNP